MLTVLNSEREKKTNATRSTVFAFVEDTVEYKIKLIEKD